MASKIRHTLRCDTCISQKSRNGAASRCGLVPPVSVAVPRLGCVQSQTSTLIKSAGVSCLCMRKGLFRERPQDWYSNVATSSIGCCDLDSTVPFQVSSRRPTTRSECLERTILEAAPTPPNSPRTPKVSDSRTLEGQEFSLSLFTGSLTRQTRTTHSVHCLSDSSSPFTQFDFLSHKRPFRLSRHVNKPQHVTLHS